MELDRALTSIIIFWSLLADNPYVTPKFEVHHSSLADAAFLGVPLCWGCQRVFLFGEALRVAGSGLKVQGLGP